uniref:Serine protease 14 n=1 Tax=Costelytra zealandica TaxID=50579 RepID=B0ZBP2_9SCAR|nr:serine protease 14 [Costelytra zealandica]
MFALKTSVFLLCLSFIYGEKSPFELINEGLTPSQRIVGGQIVQNRAHFAYQVSLRTTRNQPFCGASIIDTRSLLTAAHCVTNDRGAVVRANTIQAVVGDLNTFTPTNTTVVRQIRYIFVHEQYNADTLANDIAVLRIDNLKFNVNVNPVQPARFIPPENTSCIVSGWGTIFSGGPPSVALRYVFVPLVSQHRCNIAYSNQIRLGMVCAGYYGRDACQGDSGGPLVCPNGQLGVVSWGTGCGDPAFPGVYADVSFYFPWIQRQLERSSSSKTMLINKYTIISSIILYILVTIKLS